MADELLQTLILASEKASRIARLCRENEDLFSLLIQEKGQKHNEIDFKTFADVFIQQIVTKEVRTKFGDLADRVQGEENNLFTNTLGETISVEIANNVKDTTEMLATILDGNETAARVLAEAAHETMALDMETIITQGDLKDIASCSIDLDNVGMWVDPIDCTSQYVKGIDDAISNQRGIYEAGLQCVLVLFGVYCLDTGKPLMGVINQPFCSRERNSEKRWMGRCIWGFSHGGVRRNNLIENGIAETHQIKSSTEKNYVVLSLHDTEAMAVMKTLSSSANSGLSRGAGYKCLTVVDHQAELFLFTLHGSFKWDTCAPHAVLNSLGGGMATLDKAVKAYREHQSSLDDFESTLQDHQVTYKKPEKSTTNWKANTGGLLVYNQTQSSQELLRSVLKELSDMRPT